jgi:N-acetylglucosaminylphosphatidylinositol deacetylase
LILGLRSSSDVLVIEDSKFQDSMTKTWSAADIAQLLSSAFSPASKISPKNSNNGSDEPKATIDTLITFDAHGISSHPNHISLYHGARRWLSLLMAGKSGWKCPVELYTLTTTNVVRKYLSFLDSAPTMVMGGWRAAGVAQRRKREEPPSLLYISDFGQYRRAQKAMVKGHKSQMKWFRWGWICLGRYMVVNDLKREIIK